MCFYIGTAAEEGARVGLKPDLQGTGFNLLRVQFWTPCKRNVFQKGSESGPAWNQKRSPLEGPVLVPFWPLHCGKFVEAFISSWSWSDQQQLRLESWSGEAHFCAATFSYVLRSKKRASSLSYCFAPISRALRPWRPASKPALTCFVVISMVSRHWSSRLALRPASNFVSSYIFWFAAISITLKPRLALRPSLCASCDLKF